MTEILPTLNGKRLCWESMIVVEHDGEQRALVGSAATLADLCLFAQWLSPAQTAILRNALRREPQESK